MKEAELVCAVSMSFSKAWLGHSSKWSVKFEDIDRLSKDPRIED
jgi:hypothetical protein